MGHIILPRVKMKLFLVVGSFALLGQAYGQSSQGLNYLTPKPDCKWKEDWKQTCDIKTPPSTMDTYEPIQVYWPTQICCDIERIYCEAVHKRIQERIKVCEEPVEEC